MDYAELPRKADTLEIQADQVEFPIQYTLLTPITVDGSPRDTLTIREPTVADLEASNKDTDNLKKTVRLLSLVMEVAPDDVRRLGTRDYGHLADMVASFL